MAHVRGVDERSVEGDRPGPVPFGLVLRSVADGVGDRVAVDAGHRAPIIEEHQVEAPVLEKAAVFGVLGRLQQTQVRGGMQRNQWRRTIRFDFAAQVRRIRPLGLVRFFAP